MRLGLLGAAIGIAAALMTTRLMVAVLYGVNAMDPVAFVAAAGVVLGIALIASLVPSWRAASTDPIRALRHFHRPNPLSSLSRNRCWRRLDRTSNTQCG
jgi:putative ABC transport system permease protein